MVAQQPPDYPLGPCNAHRLVHKMNQRLSHMPSITTKGGKPRFGSAPIRLTPFECRILELRGSGCDRNDIARVCNLSPQTISKARTVAKEKLGARSLTEAAIIFSKLES